MASSPEPAARVSDPLPVLLERIERREQTARRSAVLYSLLPVALTVVLLGYTASRVKDAQSEVDLLSAKASAYTTQIDTLEKEATSYKGRAQSLQVQVTQLEGQLADAEKKLAAATDLGQYVRPINYVDAKELASRFPGSEELLFDILELQSRGVRWKLGGQSPQEGFDSPSFAMYILRQTRASNIDSRAGESLLDASRRLFESLPVTNQPRTGDLAFYPAGYALFYFADQREGPFVLGMTPFGITALKADFAKPVGYRHVQRP